MFENLKLRLLKFRKRKQERLIRQLRIDARHTVRYVPSVDTDSNGNASASALLVIDGCVIARLLRPGQKSGGSYEIRYEDSGNVREHYIDEYYKKLLKANERQL